LNINYVEHPRLVFCGVDVKQTEIAREVARLPPNATLIEEWRDAGPEKMQEADSAFKEFLLLER
jgi:hypothetical protein